MYGTFHTSPTLTHFRIKLPSIRNLSEVDISLLGGEPGQAPDNEKEANR